jgi:hypothetical protein
MMAFKLQSSQWGKTVTLSPFDIETGRLLQDENSRMFVRLQVEQAEHVLSLLKEQIMEAEKAWISTPDLPEEDYRGDDDWFEDDDDDSGWEYETEDDE